MSFARHRSTISKKQPATRHANRLASRDADLNFWLALWKDDDWPADRAEFLVDEHEEDLEVSLATFIELFFVKERFAFDRERSVTAMLVPAMYPSDPDVVSQASENLDEGLNTFDVFHNP